MVNILDVHTIQPCQTVFDFINNFRALYGKLIMQQFFLDLHLLFFVFAFYYVVREDWKILVKKQLDLDGLEHTSTLIIWLLLGLWVSGIALTYLTIGFHNMSGKMISKLSVVIILTVNAFILHYFAFPALKEDTDAKGRWAGIISIIGVISGVSWIYAAFVGTSRLIQPIMTFNIYMSFYIILLLGGLIVAGMTTRPLIKKHLTSRFNATYMPRPKR